jgi:hypothetical protein
MSNLSHQFDGVAKAYEDAQRRRYARKHETGFVGNSYWGGLYPDRVGALGAGTILQTQSEQYENPVQELGENMGHGAEDVDGMAGTATGMGEGGTAAAATGAAGGGMP